MIENIWLKIKIGFKKTWKWIAGIFIVGAFAMNIPPQGADPVPRHFAEIDANGVVLRVIAADQAFINSGVVGNPANWIPTEEGIKKNPAGKGMTYNLSLDAFIGPKPYNSWVLDTNTALWKAPKNKPGGAKYEWNESINNWEKIQ